MQCVIVWTLMSVINLFFQFSSTVCLWASAASYRWLRAFLFSDFQPCHAVSNCGLEKVEWCRCLNCFKKKSPKWVMALTTPLSAVGVNHTISCTDWIQYLHYEEKKLTHTGWNIHIIRKKSPQTNLSIEKMKISPLFKSSSAFVLKICCGTLWGMCVYNIYLWHFEFSSKAFHKCSEQAKK